MFINNTSTSVTSAKSSRHPSASTAQTTTPRAAETISSNTTSQATRGLSTRIATMTSDLDPLNSPDILGFILKNILPKELLLLRLVSHHFLSTIDAITVSNLIYELPLKAFLEPYTLPTFEGSRGITINLTEEKPEINPRNFVGARFNTPQHLAVQASYYDNLAEIKNQNWQQLKSFIADPNNHNFLRNLESITFNEIKRTDEIEPIRELLEILISKADQSTKLTSLSFNNIYDKFTLPAIPPTITSLSFQDNTSFSDFIIEAFPPNLISLSFGHLMCFIKFPEKIPDSLTSLHYSHGSPDGPTNRLMRDLQAKIEKNACRSKQ